MTLEDLIQKLILINEKNGNLDTNISDVNLVYEGAGKRYVKPDESPQLIFRVNDNVPKEVEIQQWAKKKRPWSEHPEISNLKS